MDRLQIFDEPHAEVVLFRHRFKEHLLDEPRHGRQGGEAISVFVERMHDSCHVELDSLARKGHHVGEPQHFICQLLHGAVD